MGKFDKWTILKIIEVLLVLTCLVFKRVTDDEARSVFLYLQKLSREWSLLNNITWDRVGSSVADATYGGYLIITSALLIGKLCGEIPTEKRITEFVFLGVGAILFIALGPTNGNTRYFYANTIIFLWETIGCTLCAMKMGEGNSQGSLSYAALDSVPPSLVDNAAILGTISVVTGALFLLDMGAPKAKLMPSQQSQPVTNAAKPTAQAAEGTGRSITEQVYDIEREIERRHLDDDETREKVKKEIRNNGIRKDEHKNGGPSRDQIDPLEPSVLPGRSYSYLDPTSRGYKQMKDDDFDIPRRFGIYGKDVTDNGSETDETASIPPKIELHTPIWSNIRKGNYVKYNIPPVVLPKSSSRREEDEYIPERPPSGPGDPGFVQYTAQHWEDLKRTGTKTPRHSPTEV